MVANERLRLLAESDLLMLLAGVVAGNEEGVSLLGSLAMDRTGLRDALEEQCTGIATRLVRLSDMAAKKPAGWLAEEYTRMHDGATMWWVVYPK